jgi:hypothetical protein
MNRVRVDVEEIEMEGDYADDIPGVRVTCSDCGKSVEIYGTSTASIRRGCATLRNQCNRFNFYYTGEDDI